MLMRSSGVLLHPTSLPCVHGIGSLGPEAYEFADFLAASEQRVWQLLPLTPTSTEAWNDPYHSVSVFAGNPLLISLELLEKSGWLKPQDIASPPGFPQGHVDFEAVTAWKMPLLHKACDAFEPEREPDYVRFCTRSASWLEDYALFSALRVRFAGKSWNQWPEALRNRDSDALVRAREDLAQSIERIRRLQYFFHLQWESLRAYCRHKRIFLFGDMPIYVDYDSADLWVAPKLWKLDKDFKQTVQAGVPPDYFSATGQLWESPIYDWDEHQAQGFSWWLARIHRNLELFDYLRIDHFRGLIAYWEVPAKDETALNGQWVEAPVREFLDALYASRPTCPLVAEDLGVITPDVREVMGRYELPGMKILVFAFGDDAAANPYAPHNIEEHAVVYTGTHDNNPVQGWFESETDEATRERFFNYLGHKVPDGELHWAMIRMALMSRARWAVTPVQDLLGLGAEARMNRPGNLKGNWTWRLRQGLLDSTVGERLKGLTQLYGRS